VTAAARKTSRLRLVGLGGLGLAIAVACGPSSQMHSDAGTSDASDDTPVPDMPTYAVDVKPILLANCVRCHGAGGTLNVDPASSLQYAPPNGYFDHYEDQGDCMPGDAGIIPSSCKYGAASLAMAMQVYVTSCDFPMPPPPAPRLSARDQLIITRWAAETPPLP